MPSRWPRPTPATRCRACCAHGTPAHMHAVLRRHSAASCFELCPPAFPSALCPPANQLSCPLPSQLSELQLLASRARSRARSEDLRPCDRVQGGDRGRIEGSPPCAHSTPLANPPCARSTPPAQPFFAPPRPPTQGRVVNVVVDLVDPDQATPAFEYMGLPLDEPLPAVRGLQQVCNTTQHTHSQPRTAMHSHAQPHTAAHSHTQPHTAAHSHTQPAVRPPAVRPGNRIELHTGIAHCPHALRVMPGHTQSPLVRQWSEMQTLHGHTDCATNRPCSIDRRSCSRSQSNRSIKSLAHPPESPGTGTCPRASLQLPSPRRALALDGGLQAAGWKYMPPQPLRPLALRAVVGHAAASAPVEDCHRPTLRWRVRVPPCRG